MTKAIIGIVLGLLVGVGGRLFDIPLPGPPAILGAVLAVSMATGDTATGRLLTGRAEAKSAAASPTDREAP